MYRREKVGNYSTAVLPGYSRVSTILYITNDAGILSDNMEGLRSFKVAHEMAKVAIHLAQHRYGWGVKVGWLTGNKNMIEADVGRFDRVADVTESVRYIEAQMLRVREYVASGCTVLRGDHCQTCRWSKESECYMCIKETIQ